MKVIEELVNKASLYLPVDSNTQKMVKLHWHPSIH